MTDRLRAAIGLVEANPAAIAELKAAEAAQAREAEREAQRKADLEAKVGAGLAERTRQLAEDYFDLERAAVEIAAERLAKLQLDYELGVANRAAVATGGLPLRLSRAAVEHHRARLAGSAGLPWVKGRPASEVRSELARAEAEANQAPRALTDAEVEAKRRAHAAELREAARQGRINERKAALRKPAA